MLGLTTFQLVVLTIIILFFVVGIIGRICNCIEHCATARAFGKLHEHGLNVKLEDMEKLIDGKSSKNN